jgi:hypothetical protein
MKLSSFITLLILPATGAFTVPIQNPQQTKSSLTMTATSNTDRRTFFKSTIATAPFVASAATVLTSPLPAFAKDYEPKYDDMKQIYALGMTLDNLADKVKDPNKFEAALEGIRLFNRDPKFYPGYARNFVSKSVKNNADGDARVGYVRQACTSISSLQELLEGRQGLEGQAAADEAVKRVRRAQELLALFVKESGVEDERLAAYVAKH